MHCPAAAGLALTVALLGAQSAAAQAPLPTTSEEISVPSGHKARWLDTVNDVPGPAGLTYRYRFVMPDLAKLVPATDGPAGEELTEEDMAELDGLGSAPATPGQMMDMAPIDGGSGTEVGELGEAELVDPEDLDLPDFRPEDFAEGAEADADQPGALPPDPDLLLQDPVHGDIVWLCDNWVLPRLDPAKPLPGQVVISLADRPTTFGEADLQAIQLFEAFAIAPDRKSCIWQGF
ncbi:hypothetical protein DRW48_07815 [Paracoccus suum]|uniref:Uncharacterized protein n=1 Tax=Paracoccus suum TaxID=2259340 RepID=A0A344PP47_9RHOB|nr:hypothetical protein DRW48_07815 [Paracoccus suum]